MDFGGRICVRVLSSLRISRVRAFYVYDWTHIDSDLVPFSSDVESVTRARAICARLRKIESPASNRRKCGGWRGPLVVCTRYNSARAREELIV